VLNSLASIPGPYETVILLQTTLEHAQQAIPSVVGALEVTDEGIVLRRAVRQLEWMAYFLLGLDFPVIVKEPEELREVIRRIARSLMHMTGDEVLQPA